MPLGIDKKLSVNVALNIVELQKSLSKLEKEKNFYIDCGAWEMWRDAIQDAREYGKDKKFVVVAIPSNQFNQEPLSGSKIGDFCKRNYGVDFPVLSKSDVNGESRHPLYSYLIQGLSLGQRKDPYPFNPKYKECWEKFGDNVEHQFKSHLDANGIEVVYIGNKRNMYHLWR